MIAQLEQDIKEWEQDQTAFVKTRATHYLLGSIPLNNCIVVTGSSGCGKSSNIHHAALHLRDSFGYEIIPILTGPTNIINYFNEKKNQVFIVDDICGKETINLPILQKWRDYSEQIEKIFKIVESHRENKNNLDASSPKLLISCRLHIYKDPQFQYLKFLTRKECNLLSSDLCLTEKERMLMMTEYLPSDIIDQVMQITKNVDFFPLLCKISKDKTSQEVFKLFTAPVDSIIRNIYYIITENKFHFCALVLCIVFQDGFDIDWLNLKQTPEEKKDKLIDIVKEFEINLSLEMPKNSLKTGLNTLSGTYLKQTYTRYTIIHKTIYEMAAVICGKQLTTCFIKYATVEFIRDHFIFDSITTVEASDHLIVLSKDKEDEYFERLLCDLKEFVITSTFNNKQLIYSSFIDKLVSFLNSNDKAKNILKQIDEDTQIYINYNSYNCGLYIPIRTTPLVESASGGYYDIVKFLIHEVKCDINRTVRRYWPLLLEVAITGQTNKVQQLLKNNVDCRMSALCAACKEGHRDTVKLLLENNANVSQCSRLRQFPLILACEGGHTNIVELLSMYGAPLYEWNLNGESPLFVACKEGHKDTVELLLQKKANVSQCNLKGESPLFVACKERHKDIVELLLRNNASYPLCTSEGVSPLFEACKGGHTDIVELLLRNNTNVNQRDMLWWSALCVACEGGHTDTVGLLLQNNADLSQCSFSMKFPLHAACRGGNTDTVDLILQNKANVSVCDGNGKSPLYVACEGGHKDTVELLLRNNADVSQCNTHGESPLFTACAGGHLEIVDMLLRKHADVFRCNINRQSPLYVACNKGHKNTVKLLLQNNADVNQCEHYRNSPLNVACERGHTDTVGILLQNRTDVFQRGDIGESLYAACTEGYTDIVNMLLQNKADVSQCGFKGESPLYAACRGGHTHTVELLLKNNADVMQCDEDFKSPLHAACTGGHTDIAIMLLQNNAIVNQYDKFGRISLHAACNRGHTDTVELLLQNNADVSKINAYGESPLYVSCVRGYTDTVELLLQNKADVSQCNRNGASPLYVACAGGYKNTVELLLQNKADVGQCDIRGESPLLAACKGGHKNTVELLLQNKADVGQCDIRGESPLLAACKGGHRDAVEVLLKTNADVSLCKNSGDFPLYVACKRGHTDTVALLLQNKADVSQCKKKNGKSPLHVACENLEIETFDEWGNPDGFISNDETVRLLLAWNADVQLSDNKGQTPLDIVRTSPKFVIVNLLKAHLH